MGECESTVTECLASLVVRDTGPPLSHPIQNTEGDQHEWVAGRGWDKRRTARTYSKEGLEINKEPCILLTVVQTPSRSLPMSYSGCLTCGLPNWAISRRHTNLTISGHCPRKNKEEALSTQPGFAGSLSQGLQDQEKVYNLTNLPRPPEGIRGV